jgi:hypothetical protein
MTLRDLNINVLRNRVLEDFAKECLGKKDIANVAIVGGSFDDHEVSLMRESYPQAHFQIYGIEDGQILMDLNLPQSVNADFDLVLCTNVIEHVFHHENFAKNLISLLNKNGILWCCFPFNDMYHGSPLYYAAGFDPDYVGKLFARNGGSIEKSRIISSRRSYLFTHLLKDWPGEFRYNYPLVGQVIWSLGLLGNPRPPIKNLSPNRLLICFYLSFVSKYFNSDPNYGCVSWAKIRKIDSSAEVGNISRNT